MKAAFKMFGATLGGNATLIGSAWRPALRLTCANRSTNEACWILAFGLVYQQGAF
jgi:hypothetical protein